MKPGRHTALAMLKGKPIAILPAPGLAVMAGFEQVLKPMLLKRHGVVEKHRRLQVQLAAPLHKLPGRTMLVPAKLELRGNERIAHFRTPASTYLSAALGMDGWLVLPPEHGDYKQGDGVDLELTFGSTFTVLTSGADDEATR
jgi:molybdopterin biosynthesis enzyme